MASKDDTAAGKLNDQTRCPVEEVALVVPETDDPSLPVMTFRAWFLGLTLCAVLIFLNTFFLYRTQPLTISAILMQIAALPLGKFMASTLPTTQYSVFGRSFRLNPGPFNMKEHVIITVIANCGVSIGGGDAYLVGTLVAGTVNLAVAWWMLGSIENICDVEALHPESPWTCPKFRVTFDSSVIWGLIGPGRLFGPGGLYRNLVWLFLVGAVLPVPVWILSKIFPKKKWIALINIPVISYGFAGMPPATPTNIASWIITGTIFNYFVFKFRKGWWQKYNYVLSAALDAGTAFMGVLLFFALQNEGRNLKWWGTEPDHCPLATCPTARSIVVQGCPVFK
ncbi:Oligopeptide transporter like [Actinidia chinensis var. chinensis]|uniref:Oligopeptide transporter like n=1 Tax=Actinidia chinensis var. chinensis TaxID=1590841 RepID=A0A2R6QM05_ACTCC|nr:Oligopeptide transporter like [Actinidia chinensis var. chinensis]